MDDLFIYYYYVIQELHNYLSWNRENLSFQMHFKQIQDRNNLNPGRVNSQDVTHSKRS